MVSTAQRAFAHPTQFRSIGTLTLIDDNGEQRWSRAPSQDSPPDLPTHIIWWTARTLRRSSSWSDPGNR